MDDYTYSWLFASWIQNQDDEVEKMKSFGCFVGAFWNPEQARKISGQGISSYESSDEDFDKTTELIRKYNESKLGAGLNKKRRKLRLK